MSESVLAEMRLARNMELQPRSGGMTAGLSSFVLAATTYTRRSRRMGMSGRIFRREREQE